MMIQDMRLQVALEAVDEVFLSSLPDESSCKHVFSDRFERKMQRVFRRAAHPLARKVLLRAACVLLVLTTLFAGLMAFNPAVRATVMGWIKSWMGNYHSYSYQTPPRNNEPPVYYLSNLPAGYVYVGTHKSEHQETQVYANEVNKIIRFTYLYETNLVPLYNKNIDYVIYQTVINGYSADLYISTTPEMNNHIIWTNQDQNVLFYISGNYSQSELIDLAECVRCT